MQAFLMFIAGLFLGLWATVQLLDKDLSDGCANWNDDQQLCIVDRP